MAAEVAFVKLINSDAGLTAILQSRVVVGQIPQTMQLPCVNMVRESTKPNETKSQLSAVDEEVISVVIRDLNYRKVLDLSDLIRNLLDGIKNQDVVIDTRTVSIEHVWFSGEAYDNYEHQDKIIEVHEQKYTVRIKR